jgi:hypothetical protein
MPDYEDIKVSPADEKRAKEIYQACLDNPIWKEVGSLNNEDDDILNKGVLKIMSAFKKKFPDDNWDILKKPIFDNIHGGLT